MENASKALLIAGGVLLAILVVSLGIYMRGFFNDATNTYVSKLDATELRKYNNPFEVFIGREDVTAQEIVSLVGDSKQKYENVTVSISNLTPDFRNMQNLSNEQLSDFLNDNIQYSDDSTNQLVYFKFKNIGYDNDGKVNYIEFEKIGGIKDNPTTPEKNIKYEKYEVTPEQDDPTNEPPYFFNTDVYGTNVGDKDNDLVKIAYTTWVYTVNKNNWQNSKKYAQNPETIPENLWVKQNSKNSSEEISYYDDYSTKKYSTKTLPSNWWEIVRVQYKIKDKYHDWVYSGYYYKLNTCSGATLIYETEVVGTKEVTGTTGGKIYTHNPSGDAPNAKCPYCDRTDYHTHILEEGTATTSTRDIIETTVTGTKECDHGRTTTGSHEWWN